MRYPARTSSRRLSRASACCAAALLLVLVAGACSDGEAGELKLDGSPRHPQDQGIATEVTREKITLDGERAYPVASNFRSFSTYTLKLEPMLNREGQFVHLGVDDGEAVWMAGVGAVVTARQPFVPYQGTVKDVDGRLVAFADGTVLPLARGVEAPEQDAFVTAEIDPETGRVRLFR